jgi:hypothetical protein
VEEVGLLAEHVYDKQALKEFVLGQLACHFHPLKEDPKPLQKTQVETGLEQQITSQNVVTGNMVSVCDRQNSARRVAAAMFTHGLLPIRC